jgi:hypothetical protein
MALANSVAREDLPSLDVLKWLRSDVLVAGALFEQRLPMQDGSGRSVRVALLSSTRAVVFSTDTPDVLVEAAIELQWVNCRFGGRSAWFACPRCGTRCGKLYQFGDWKCRRCCALPYRSQTLTAADRCLHRASKLRQKLNGREQAERRLGSSTQHRLLVEITNLERQGRLLSLQAFLGLQS